METTSLLQDESDVAMKLESTSYDLCDVINCALKLKMQFNFTIMEENNNLDIK